MQITPDFDPPKRVHHLTLIFAISGLFIENESRFLINFTIITDQWDGQLRNGHFSGVAHPFPFTISTKV